MRPARNIFMHDLQIVFVIEFVARENAELVAGPEKCDRDHEGTGKLEGVVLGEGKIGLWSGPIPLDGSVSVRPRSRSPRRASPKRPQLASGPPRGLIVEDPGTDQEAITRERDWIASRGDRPHCADLSNP
ncbi:hypothetical protein G6M86_27885 (plasmid) [Agrobacterium tumefaciens]|uniref:Uncharacterized protein n=1 Tax=Agrobacterium tumefaciens TaxID=358 RepID=A0AAJ4N973_AGRTU|nr:hypothetical protein G6M86_27885 [Agrobacterium tumefaciens]